MPREELKSRLKMMPRFFTLAMKKMAAEGILTENPRWIANPGHVVRFSPFQQVKVDELNQVFASSPLAPPSVKDCTARVGEEVFNLLLESSDLVAVSADIVFRKIDYDAMVEKIRQEIQQKGKITLAEVRDLLNTSRKYVQALLEHMDSLGITERVGDFRKLK
jgi:selenocysteine-specific elongation factor